MLGFAFSICVARGLGPEGKGILDLSSATIGLLSLVLGASIHVGLTQEVANKGQPPEHATRNMVLVSMLMIVPAIILVGPFQTFAQTLGLLPDKDTGFWAVIACVGAWLGILSVNLRGIVIGLHDMISCNRIDLLARLIIAMASALLFLRTLPFELPYGKASLVGFAALSAVLFQVISYATRLRVRAQTRTGATPAHVRTAFLLSIPIHATNILHFINHKADLFFIQSTHGAAELGVYALATSLTQLLILSSAAFAQPLLPAVAAATPDKANELTASACRAYLLVSAAMGTAMAVSAPLAVPLIFGASFTRSLLPMYLLIPGVVAFGLSNLLISHFVGVGRPRINLYISIVSALATLLGNALFTPRWGALAAASVSTFSYMLSALLSLAMLRQGKTPIELGRLFPRAADLAVLRETLARFRP
jgi:O-antigen/teichoic acid export membrane protein